jgi:CheY-like chemotaxis protein
VLQPKVFDLNETIAGLEDRVRQLLGEQIQLTCELADVPLRIFADPVQLQQVVLNLAVNARDAMPHGGPLTIRTRLRRLNEAEASALDLARMGPYVQLQVIDRGCGMEPDILGRILEPFCTTKEPNKGTRPGLATAYDIIKQSGGAITVESTPQVGSAFTVLIPLERRLEPRPADQPAVVLTEQTRGTETLLVVEDDPGIRRSVEAVLRRQGYTVLMTSEPAAALDLLRNLDFGPQLLVTDVVMPGMSGTELALAAREQRPALKVLFMSGYPKGELFRDDVGVSGMPFLPKPFTLPEFLHKVRSVLDGRQGPGSDAA